MNAYVITREEDNADILELPTESDGTLLLSTLSAQYPGVTGLKYKVENNYRGVRMVNGAFHPPEGYWGKTVYFCVFPKENKRKCDDSLSHIYAKTKRLDRNLCSDLIVLGLPFKMSDAELKEYFQLYGEVIMAVVKKDPSTGQSKGFGFIRFQDYDCQLRALSKRHLIDGRWCDVKIPNSRDGCSSRVPCKIFVGRVTENITNEDLVTYFSQFGAVTDVYIPKPFRSFAFVTFESPEVAQSLWGEDHILKGVSIHISEASPRAENTSRNSHASGGASGNNQGRKMSKSNNEGVKWPSNEQTSTLLSALGLNPAVIAALNQGWSMINGQSSNQNTTNGKDSSGVGVVPQQIASQAPPPPYATGSGYTYSCPAPPPPPVQSSNMTPANSYSWSHSTNSWMRR